MKNVRKSLLFDSFHLESWFPLSPPPLPDLLIGSKRNEQASVTRTFTYTHGRLDGGSTPLFPLSLSPVGCTCDYTSAYLMGRVARGRYLSATPRPLRPSAIPLLNREHLAIYSRCTVSRFPERLCVWQNGCHENRVPFFFVFFLFLSLALARSRSLSLSLPAYHCVTSLIPIAPYLLATRLDRGPFFTLSLSPSFFPSFLFLLLREDKRTVRRIVRQRNELVINTRIISRCYVPSIFILLA